jgi:hypothetical protein
MIVVVAWWMWCVALWKLWSGCVWCGMTVLVVAVVGWCGGMVWWDGVGIWVGVWFGGGDVDCGGGGVYVEMRDVACGGGGCVVVFYLHSLLSSISPAQPMLSIFPAES